eukprot:Clim_evm39s55 gene=Clim_evmTU39s55
MGIEILPLGAGQDVGRSCILVRFNRSVQGGGRQTWAREDPPHQHQHHSTQSSSTAARVGRRESAFDRRVTTAGHSEPYTVLLDCGAHLGHSGDVRTFPDLRPYINEVVAVVVTHFHLDHCGALPVLVGHYGYRGPIYMTAPTKTVLPILLNDFAKIMARKSRKQYQQHQQPGGQHQGPQAAQQSGTPRGRDQDLPTCFTQEDIQRCMERISLIGLHETVQVLPDLTIKAYYAGHVLGAAMFLVKYRGSAESVLYSGDYNLTPERHLGATVVDRCQPTVFITESTYASTIRRNRFAREHDFLSKVERCIRAQGIVLIPCFAIGRAQELVLLLSQWWDRRGIDAPIHVSSDLMEVVLDYYRMYQQWTLDGNGSTTRSRTTGSGGGDASSKYVRPLDPDMELKGPAVIFAAPGMLTAGTSLAIFAEIAEDERNMVVIPGYCVAHTVGAKLLQGQRDITLPATFDAHGRLEQRTLSVKLSVENLAFSAHVDARGILSTIRTVQPTNVVLVHGDRKAMKWIKDRIFHRLGIPCYNPPTGVTLCFSTDDTARVSVPRHLLCGQGSVRGRLVTGYDGTVDGITLIPNGSVVPPSSISTTSTPAPGSKAEPPVPPRAARKRRFGDARPSDPRQPAPKKPGGGLLGKAPPGYM